MDIIVPIEKSVKGQVMGKSGQKLRKLGEDDNTHVYRSRGNVHARAPNKEKAKRTSQSVQTEAVSRKMIKPTPQSAPLRNPVLLYCKCIFLHGLFSNLVPRLISLT